MATNKKSFLLYCDVYEMVKKLPDEKAGQLFKHILSYVNDENPETDDILLQIAFEPIKLQMKRDLRKWESICERNKENGSKGGRPKKTEENPENPLGYLETQTNPDKPKKADIDNDTDNEIVIKKDERRKPIKIDLQTRKQNFIDEVALFKGKYTSELLNAFYNYWTELNQSKTKMRFELEKTFEVSKRLLTWSKKEYGTNKQSNSKNQGASLEQIAAIADRVFGDLPDR